MIEEGQHRSLPQLIAFDLDYTLWDFWIDTHIAGPLKCKGSTVKDRNGSRVEFYPHVPQILNHIRSFDDTKIAACSRTSAVTLAREALSLIRVPLTEDSSNAESEHLIPAERFFDQMEIYPGSKLTHFKELHRKTGIPYTEMVFYDDELRNKEVERLGVTFVLVRRGLDMRTFEKGLDSWRKKRNPIVPEDS